MKRKVLLPPLFIIILIIIFGVGIVGAAVYFGGAGGTEEVNLQKGLVGWWKFDGNAKDATPNVNHGTVFGATLTTDRKGQVNKAYNFDGVNDYVSIPNNIVALNSDFSISMWINPQDNGASYNPRWFTLMDTLNTLNVQIGVMNTEKIYMRVNSSTFQTDSTIGYGSWLHVVANYIGGTRQIYVNGTLWASSAGGVTAEGTFSAIGAGYAVDSHTTKGVIDDVRIYNRKLSQTEITALYQEYNSAAVQISDLQKGVVGQWKMDGNAKDSSPNISHGTVAGATLTTDRKGQVDKAYNFNGTTDSIDISDQDSLDPAGEVTIEAWISP